MIPLVLKLIYTAQLLVTYDVMLSLKCFGICVFRIVYMQHYYWHKGRTPVGPPLLHILSPSVITKIAGK